MEQKKKTKQKAPYTKQTNKNPATNKKQYKQQQQKRLQL